MRRLDIKIIKTALAVVVLVMLTLLIISPVCLWMTDHLIRAVLILFMLAFVVFIGFIWKEQINDEREAEHEAVAGRYAFMFGTGILAAGTIIQTFNYNLDPWLPLSLAGMVVIKLVVSLITSRNS